MTHGGTKAGDGVKSLLEKAPSGEWVFKLYAGEDLAWKVVEFYAKMLEWHGGDSRRVAAARLLANAMRSWPVPPVLPPTVILLRQSPLPVAQPRWQNVPELVAYVAITYTDTPPQAVMYVGRLYLYTADHVVIDKTGTRVPCYMQTEPFHA